MKTIRKFLAAAAAACALAGAPSTHAGLYSDLWWNPQESGWGVNVVQQLETAFVTLFVYGADGKPVWYVAPDARITAYGSAGPLFTGTLYRTDGPWQGGAFDPARVHVFAVGPIALEVLSRDRMRVHYSADGANNVVKEVVRQTWEVPLLAANYASQFILRLALPDGRLVGTSEFQGDMFVSFIGSEAFLRTDDHLGRRCEYRGPFTTTGKLIKASGTFTCTVGDATAGTFELSEFQVTDNGVTGFLRTVAANIHSAGRFAGARR